MKYLFYIKCNIFCILSAMLSVKSYINNFLKQCKHVLHNYIKIIKFLIAVTILDNLWNKHDKGYNNSQ